MAAVRSHVGVRVELVVQSCVTLEQYAMDFVSTGNVHWVTVNN